MNDATPVQPAGIAWTYPKVSWVGPVGLEPTTRGLKGRRIAATVAPTCDYVLTASPTSPTSRPQSTSFHATNHATRVALVAVLALWHQRVEPRPGLTHLQFEALLTAAKHSAETVRLCACHMLGLLGLQIFEATGNNIEDLGEEHGHRVLPVRGKGDKVVLVPLPSRRPRH
jgi:hypothetical protein